MQLIKQEKFNKTIKENFDYNFEVKQGGLYLIEIIASCKSWKQNLIKFISFFKDDDLTIKINNVEFLKLNGKRGLFDGEVAWNGNNLKGLFKTNIFVIYLKQDIHTIQFLVDQKPYLKSIQISRIEDLKKIVYIPTENNPAQDGNRRQWINVVLIDLQLKYLFIKAKADKRKKDDDDIKLIIDGKVQKNTESKSHKYWYWCGRILKGQDKEFNKKVNMPKGLHYIELWADRMPFLYRAEIELGLKEDETPEKDKTPTVDNPKWTGDFNDDTEQMILARAIYGEARNEILSDKARIAVGWSIRNRVEDTTKFGNNYNEVILKEDQYSAFRKSDENRPYVEDPLHTNNLIDKRAWENCYKVAGQVMLCEVDDPTDGANHYYDESIDSPYWANNENFKIKIDSIFFHRL